MKIDLKELATLTIQNKLARKKYEKKEGIKRERRLGKDRLLYKAVQKKNEHI